MQLNGKVIKGVRSVRAFWISFVAMVFGLAFLGFAVYFYISDSAKTFETANATITEISSEQVGESPIYHLTLIFTDKQGVSHTATLDTSESKWSVGNTITIKYDVNNPTDVRQNSPTLLKSIVFGSLGAIAFLVGLICVITTIKQLKRKPKKAGNVKTFSSDLLKNPVQDIKLFFHPKGKLKQSYAIETKQGKVVFECKLVRFHVFGASVYEFIDHKTGDSKRIKIGKTLTSSSSGGMILVGDILSSRFKIDGTNCWDYVADKGYEIKHLLQGKTIISYKIVKGGKTIAHVFPANVKHPFDQNNTNYLRMGKGYYRLEISQGNLPDIAMMAFIISKTDIVE